MKINDNILKNWGYHGNFPDLVNQTVHFFVDSEKKLYQKDMKDPSRKKLIERFGWTDTNITYTFNSDGFRSDEFNQQCYILTAGCSESFGHSLDLESMWAKKLCDHFNCAHMNIAIPGSAWKNVAMRIGYWVPKLKPKIVAIFSPPTYRLGWIRHWHDGYVGAGFVGGRYSSSHMKIKLKSKLPGNRFGYTSERPFVDMLNDDNVTYNMISNIEFIKKICKDNSSECLIVNSATIFNDFNNISDLKLDLARDLDHSGKVFNNLVFEYFKEQISKIE